MNDDLLPRLKEHVNKHGGPTYAVAPPNAVQEAEAQLGFEIPPLLKACYLEIANGGLCDHRGLIGLRGGYDSDFGDIVGTHHQLKSDQELEGRTWPGGMLPFFEWGCNKFSCVSCVDSAYPIYTFEDFGLKEAGFNLDEFFEKWLAGDPMHDETPEDSVEFDIINPFTGKKEKMKIKRSGGQP